MIFSENRFPPRIKSGAGFFGILRSPKRRTPERHPFPVSARTLPPRSRGDGKFVDVKRRHINEYIKEVMGVSFSAKDFRTWGGTLRAATVLAELGKGKSQNERKKNVVTAVRLVAS